MPIRTILTLVVAALLGLAAVFIKSRPRLSNFNYMPTE